MKFQDFLGPYAAFQDFFPFFRTKSKFQDLLGLQHCLGTLCHRTSFPFLSGLIVDRERERPGDIEGGLGPKARAFGTFNIIQFCMFPEKIGTIACIEKIWRHFCRRQVEIVQEFPYYSQNHIIEKILPKFYPNKSIFGPKLDIDSTNISCNFGEILRS